MPDRDVLALGEGHAEQPGRHIKGRIDHVIEREIRLDRRIVEVGAALAQLFGVVAPVPGGELEVATLFRDQGLQGIAVGHGAGAGRFPDPFQQAAHGLRCLRHRVLQPVGGEARVTENLGALLAQLEDFENDGVIVVGVAIVAAGDEGLVELLAQVAAGGILQEGLDEGARQRHQHLARLAALVSGGLGGGDKAFRQTCKIVCTKLHGPLLLVAEQMVAEVCREMCQPLVDLGGPRLGCLGEPGAGAVKAGPGPLQKPRLLARQIERGCLVAQLRDAAKQRSIHGDRIPVPRLLQRHFGLDLKKLRIGVRTHEVIEHRRDLGEQLAGTLQCRDGILERRLLGVGLNGLDLRRVIGKGLVEGRRKVLRADIGEGRCLERRLPGSQQRVGLGGGSR